MEVATGIPWVVEGRKDDRVNRNYHALASIGFTLYLDEDELDAHHRAPTNLRVDRMLNPTERVELTVDVMELLGPDVLDDVIEDNFSAWIWTSDRSYGVGRPSISISLAARVPVHRPSRIWTKERFEELLPYERLAPLVEDIFAKRVAAALERLRLERLVEQTNLARESLVELFAKPVERQLRVTERIKQLRDELELEIRNDMEMALPTTRHAVAALGGYPEDVVQLALDIDPVVKLAMYRLWPLTERGPGSKAPIVSIEQLETDGQDDA